MAGQWRWVHLHLSQSCQVRGGAWGKKVSCATGLPIMFIVTTNTDKQLWKNFSIVLSWLRSNDPSPQFIPHCKPGFWPHLLWSWALLLIFHHFSTIYSALSVTHSLLVPSCTTQTATKPPDKSPDGSPDYSAVRYHMLSLRSPQHSAASPFNPLWIASSLPRHDETASSWWSYT